MIKCICEIVYSNHFFSSVLFACEFQIVTKSKVSSAYMDYKFYYAFSLSAEI